MVCPQNFIVGFLRHNSGPVLASKSRANLSIAFYSVVDGPTVFPHPVTFSYELPFSKYRPAVTRNFGNFCESLLYIGCRYSVGSIGIDFLFGSLVGLMDALHQQLSADDLNLLL